MPATTKSKSKPKPKASAKAKSTAKPKPAAKPTAPRAPGVTALAADDAELDLELGLPAPTHSWEELIRAHGAATDDDRELYAVRSTGQVLLDFGRRIASGRILRDLLRFCCQIHDDGAKRGEGGIVGFSEAFFRVVLEDGKALADLYATSLGDAKATTTAAKSDEASLASRAESLRARFESVFATVDHATRNSAAMSARVAACYTRALAPEVVAASTESLVAVARELLKSERFRIARRLVDSGVDSAKLGALESTAKAVAALSKRASAPRAAPKVTQRQLDLQQGVCITHMQTLIDVFTAARDADPSVPNLIPIATRSLFGYCRPAAQEEPAAAETDDSPAETADKPKKPLEEPACAAADTSESDRSMGPELL
jgi:hypothetical protein